MTFREEAPLFHVWNEGGVHELVCHDKADLHRRKSFGISRCTDKDCDWCAENRTHKLIGDLLSQKLQIVLLKEFSAEGHYQVTYDGAGPYQIASNKSVPRDEVLRRIEANNPYCEIIDEK
jgi:hypothetical protein